MAIVGIAEQKFEDAWVNALGLSADLTALATVRKWSDQDNAQIYPVCLVHCSGVEDPDLAGRDGYDAAFITVSCQTFMDDDKDKDTVERMLGAVRDVTRDPAFLSNLGLVGGINVQNVIQDGASFVNDETNIRIRALTFVCYGSLIHGV